MSNNKQSSIEWLYNELFPKQIDGFSEDEWSKIDKAFEQAKARHKEETTSFTADWSVQWKYDNGVSIIQYYNETFNNK